MKTTSPVRKSRIIFYDLRLNGEMLLASMQPENGQYAVCYRGVRIGETKTIDDGLVLIMGSLKKDLSERIQEGQRAQEILDGLGNDPKKLKKYRLRRD